MEQDDLPRPVDFAAESLREVFSCECIAAERYHVETVTAGALDDGESVEVTYTIHVDHLPLCRYATSRVADLN